MNSPRHDRAAEFRWSAFDAVIRLVGDGVVTARHLAVACDLSKAKARQVADALSERRQRSASDEHSFVAVLPVFEALDVVCEGDVHLAFGS